MEKMAPRLGNVLYWLGTAVAIFMVLNGLTMAIPQYYILAEDQNTTALEAGLLSIAVGGVVWLLGRAFRYVLAGR
jgi:hypothetical protein